MKIGPQVYVRNSVEAAQNYCKAFGAEISFQITDTNGMYAHCELSVDDKLFLALSEAPQNCEQVTSCCWRTMAFNVYDLGTEEAVRNAFEILAEGGTVIDPVGSCDWSKCCANVIDKYGVFWWLAV